jgi:LacI family transcriptional regulator
VTDSRRPRRRRRSETPGIREIAHALGISIGTVDRALHDRPGISAATRARVLSTAERLGYRPDPAARYLSSRRELRIGVALPREIASFWGSVRDGIHRAAGPARRTGVRVIERPYLRLGVGEAEAFVECLEQDVDGLIIAPGEPERLEPLIARASEQRVPVVCVNTDAPGTSRLCTVSVDSLTSGSLVGELMGRFLGGRGLVVPFAGRLATIDHSQKVEGFRRTVAALWPGLEVADVVEAHDDEGEAHAKCRAVLAARPRIDGVYVTTMNSLPVLRAIEDEGLGKRVTVVTTDFFPALAPPIESGRVAATIHQRPETQGRIAFEALHLFLVEGHRPPPYISLSPQIVMRSNLPLYRERVRPRSTPVPQVTAAPEAGP